MTTTENAPASALNHGPLEKLAMVRDGFRAGVLRAPPARREQLQQMRLMLVEHETEFAAALKSDLGKSAIEAQITEIGFMINEIDHAIKHMDAWLKPEKVRLPVHMLPGSGRVVSEPLGTVLIIAPWNYPLQLLLAPLVPAIAAGNTAILKPSEVAPATATVIERLLPEYLDAGVVQVVNGGVPETTTLLAERFDHIFYTGNGTVGRIVMTAAAKHLTPVTLELGGKSPAIVTEAADIDVSARRIAWGKFTNAGQTCVAPDYVLVDERVAAEFTAAIKSAVAAMYGSNPAESDDYGRIVNERHANRLATLLEAGGYDSVVTGGTVDIEGRYIAPTIVSGVAPDAAMMDDEIFGPILPIITYSGVDEAIQFVNDRPKPLALYAFTRTSETADQITSETTSGGVTINHTLMHLAVPDFPFGGVGASGMGSYHGEAGFRVFSHRKPILKRTTKPDPKLAYPPYSALKRKILRKLF